MIGIGIVGAGRWARMHAEAIARVPGTRLVAACVSAAGSRAEAEAALSVPVDVGIGAVLTRGDLHAVIVCSPNHLHQEHALASIGAGRHVLVEKPLALPVNGCLQIRAAARARGVVLALGHEFRGFTLSERLDSVLEEGRLGPLRHLHIDLWRRLHRAGAGGWRQDPARRGAPLLEEPTHYLDLARWLTRRQGVPVAARGATSSAVGREELQENLDLLLHWPDGLVALVTRTLGAFGHRVMIRAIGESAAAWCEWAGRFDADLEPEVSLEIGRGDEATIVPLDPRSGHAYDLPRQLAAFAAAVRAGGRPLANGRDGQAAVALCLAASQAAREGGDIALELPGDDDG